MKIGIKLLVGDDSALLQQMVTPDVRSTSALLPSGHCEAKMCTAIDKLLATGPSTGGTRALGRFTAPAAGCLYRHRRRPTHTRSDRIPQEIMAYGS